MSILQARSNAARLQTLLNILNVYAGRCKLLPSLLPSNQLKLAFHFPSLKIEKFISSSHLLSGTNFPYDCIWSTVRSDLNSAGYVIRSV